MSSSGPPFAVEWTDENPFEAREISVNVATLVNVAGQKLGLLPSEPLIRIERPDGSVLWTQENTRVAVMDPRDAYQMTSMLRSVVDRGTATAIRGYGVTTAVAGKTGTTNNGADVWFVGYTKSLVAGFWFGYDTPRSISGDANGGRLAAPAWAEFYQQGWSERKTDDEWAPPVVTCISSSMSKS